MKEDYCSFEISKLLKEKGFDEVCTRVYIEIEGRWGNYPYQPTTNSQIKEVIGIMCPTHQMAMKWLREKHKLFIDISFQKDEDGSVTWFYMTWALDDRKRDAEEVDFASYEEAVEAALKYTLKNLI